MKFNPNISQKLGINTFSLVLFVTATAIYTVFALTKAEETSRTISEQLQPTVNYYSELNNSTQKSIQFVDIWINNPTKDIKENYKNTKESITATLNGLADVYNKSRDTNTMHVINRALEMMQIEKQITDTLKQSSDYVSNKGVAQELFKKLEGQREDFRKLVESSILDHQKVIAKGQRSMLESFTLIKYVLIGLIVLVIAVGAISYYVTYSNVVRPISELKKIVIALAKGKLPEVKVKFNEHDEVGEMAGSVYELIDGLEKTSAFAEEIGKGNLDSEFTPLSDEDILGNSLITMRENLNKFNEQERKQNWATQGMAKFATILRDNNNNLEQLSREVIINLVKYVNANQGGIFVIHQKNDGEEYLNLEAFYAYNREKFADKKVLLGEGLVGQCWEEGETIYLTDVPEGYMEVKSGLGGTDPRCVVIVPLIVNEQIYGVLEIASFEILEQYIVDFLEKLGESMASTLSTVNVNMKTKKLLEESKEMSEQLQSQEEELRQNTEEMLATQEEMQRKIESLEKELEGYKNDKQ